MARDIGNSNYCYISFRTQRVSDCVKKIGFYFGKLKNVISSFQREVNSVNESIDIEEDIVNQKANKKEKKNNNE